MDKLKAKFKADGRDPETITIAPTDMSEGAAEEQKPAGWGEFPPKQEITIVPPKKLKSGQTYQDQNKYWQSQGQAPIYKTNEEKEPTTRQELLNRVDKIQRMMTQDRNPANLQILRKELEMLKQRYQHLREDSDSEAVEIAIIKRILIAHTDLIMEFGLDKVTQAIEEVAYNVGDVDEIGTSDVSAYVQQVKQILGVVAEEKTRLDPKCWKGKKIGTPKTKVKGGVRVNNCVPVEEQQRSGYNQSRKIK
jgi:hypothetical protein